MPEMKIECWDEIRAIWVDGTPYQDPIELMFWFAKWAREGQTVRITLGEPH